MLMIVTNNGGWGGTYLPGKKSKVCQLGGVKDADCCFGAMRVRCVSSVDPALPNYLDAIVVVCCCSCYSLWCFVIQVDR